MKIALAISHSPWIAARRETMASLRASLNVMPDGSAINARDVVGYHEEKERAPNWHWSLNMWSWAAATDADDCLFLQDDLAVPPNFWPAYRALRTSRPDAILDLSCVHPAAKRIAREGKRGYTTADGLVGLGYSIPREVLRELLAFRRDALHSDALEWTHEDSLINIFALCTGKRIFHPVPTLIDHDVSVRSSYGNDEHAYRSPSVIWEDGDVCGWSLGDLIRQDFWVAGGDPPHLGRQYKRTHWVAKKLVKDFTLAQFRAAERDECPPVYARYFTRP